MNATTRAAAVFLAAVMLPLAGCSQPVKVRDNVSGAVTLDGKPLAAGIVTLHGPEGQTATGAILADGRYSIDDPPMGMCEVTVEGPPGFASPNAVKGDSHSPPPEAVSSIPKRYGAKGNGLSVEVKPGSTRYDIELKQ